MRHTSMSGKLGVLVFLLGCSGASPSTNPGGVPGETSTATRPAPAPPSTPPQIEAAPIKPPPGPVHSKPAAPAPAPAPAGTPAAAGPRMGEDCGPGDACGAGLACVKYYGIAGARGPEFRSCEVRCTGNADCPKGTGCTTISDGPGRVCR